MQQYFTEQNNFYGGSTPHELIRKFGSPLYVYSETVLRQRCKEMAGLIQLPNFSANYSTKANANVSLLKIIHEEGLHADAMSPGEIYVLLAAGFKPEEIFYISNNVSEAEMRYAIDKNITISIDSLSQLRTFGRINPGGKVAVRFNPGVGAGHHEKVITGGKKTKFGINTDKIDDVKSLLKEYQLKLIGINQHIGSLFMDGDPYIEGVRSILSTAEHFEGLEFIDLGGGFGIPYQKQDDEDRLELENFSNKLTNILYNWSLTYNKNILFKSEPGRYIVAESGILLGTVNALKENSGTVFVGTDLGFNTLQRPVMYDSHHDIEVYKKIQPVVQLQQRVTVVGNICESGDIVAKERTLPIIKEGDMLGVMDAGAYGYSMASNYNNRLRPAEVLITKSGTPTLIRRRDTLEDLMNNFSNDCILSING